jgi:hypothetical protein
MVEQQEESCHYSKVVNSSSYKNVGVSVNGLAMHRSLKQYKMQGLDKYYIASMTISYILYKWIG